MPDPSRWLNERFAGWANLTRQEKKAIKEFPILWAIFELRSTGQNGARPNATPDRIRLAVDALTDNFNPIVLEGPREYFKARYFDNDGQETYAFQQLNVHENNLDDVKKALIEGDADQTEILLGLLLVVNRLRNNFLHGEKARYAFVGQFENFKHANNILMLAIPLWPDP